MTMACKKKWVECGRASRSWGIRGELLVEWWSGACPVTFGNPVYVRDGADNYAPFVVIKSRPHGGRHVVQLKGITSRTEAESLHGATFFLPEDALKKLCPGEYYSYQILGLEVFTEDGEFLGKVTKIFSAGIHDIYEVTGMHGGKSREILIPAVAHVIVNIDIAAKRIVVKKVKGLL